MSLILFVVLVQLRSCQICCTLVGKEREREREKATLFFFCSIMYKYQLPFIIVLNKVRARVTIILRE